MKLLNRVRERRVADSVIRDPVEHTTMGDLFHAAAQSVEPLAQLLEFIRQPSVAAPHANRVDRS